MKTVKQVLLERDGLSEIEANNQISEFRATMYDLIEEGEDLEEIFMEEFGLEPDYLDEFLC